MNRGSWGHRDSTASAKGGSIGFSHSGCGERSVMVWWVNHARVQNQRVWVFIALCFFEIPPVKWLCLLLMFCESFQGVSIKVWQIWYDRFKFCSWEPWSPQTMAENQPTKTTHRPVRFHQGHQRMVLAAAVRLRSTLDREVGFHHLQTEMGMVMSVGGDGDDMLKQNLLALFSFTLFPWTSCECPMMKLISLSHPEIWRILASSTTVQQKSRIWPSPILLEKRATTSQVHRILEEAKLPEVSEAERRPQCEEISWVEQVGNSKRKWFYTPKQGDQKIQLRVVQPKVAEANRRFNPFTPNYWGLQRFLTLRTIGKTGGLKVSTMEQTHGFGWTLKCWKIRLLYQLLLSKTMCQKSIGIRYNQQMEIIKRLKSQTYITWKSNVSWALLHCWQTDHDDSDGGRDPWEFLMIRPGGFAWFSTTKPNYQISWRNVLLETWTS